MIIIPYVENLPSVASTTSATIDADGEYGGWVFSAPSAMTVTDIAFYVSTLTTGDNIDVRVETVDATTGLPTGTLWATNTNILVNVTSTGRWNGTLTASASLNAGDIFCVKIVRPTAGTFNGVLRLLIGGNIAQHGFPYRVLNAGSPTKAAASSPVALELKISGPSYPRLGIKAQLLADATEAFTSASTPDERGNRLLLPGGWVTAFMVEMNAASTACDFVLYDLNNNAVITTNWDLDLVANAAAAGPCRLPCTRTLISAGEYRAVVKPGATSVTMGVTGALNDGALREQMLQGGLNIQYTSRTDAGAWTDVTTKLAKITVEMDIHEGLRRHPGMTGGVSA